MNTTNKQTNKHTTIHTLIMRTLNGKVTGALLATFCCPQHTHPHYMTLIVAPSVPLLYHYAHCPVCHHGATEGSQSYMHVYANNVLTFICSEPGETFSCPVSTCITPACSMPVVVLSLSDESSRPLGTAISPAIA